MVHPRGVESEIRRLSIAQRWRLLSVMARKYPSAVTDALSRMKPKKDVTVVGWVIREGDRGEE